MPVRICSTLLGCALLLPGAVSAQSAEGDIGYASVELARSALLAREDVKLSTTDGWLSIEDPVGMTLWTFAPDSDPAHPAVIKRSVIEDGDGLVIRMDIRCEGDVDACDGLEEHFMSLNESVRDQVQSTLEDN